MAGRLQDKVALVVGAGSVGPGWGNGKAAATLFAREGAKVLCADVYEEAANETARIIAPENGMAKTIKADVTSHDDIRRMVRRARMLTAGSACWTTMSASRMSAGSSSCRSRSGTGSSQ